MKKGRLSWRSYLGCLRLRVYSANQRPRHGRDQHGKAQHSRDNKTPFYDIHSTTPPGTSNLTGTRARLLCHLVESRTSYG
jgi:hypothetical protein